MLSLFKRFSVNFLCSQAAISSVWVTALFHIWVIQYISVSFLVYIPWYLLTCLGLKWNMTLKKSRIKETELLLSFSALDRPDLTINQSVGSILLWTSTENKVHLLTTRYSATFFPWAVSFSPFPTTLGSRPHYLHFIVTLSRSHSQTVPGSQPRAAWLQSPCFCSFSAS